MNRLTEYEMGWKIRCISILGLLISGCAVQIERLPPPEQPEPVLTQITTIEPELNIKIFAEPGETLLRVINYWVSERTIKTHMWQPESDFAVDTIMWPEYSATTEDFFVAAGTAEWRGVTYIALDEEDGNIAWGPAPYAHLLMNQDGTFEGIMAVGTGTFRTKIVRGPSPVRFKSVSIDRKDTVVDGTYINFEIVFVDKTDGRIRLARRDYMPNSQGVEELASETIVLLDTNLTGYSAGKWFLEIQPAEDSKIQYSASVAAH